MIRSSHLASIGSRTLPLSLCFVLSLVQLSGCKGPGFIQDPLDYLGVGVDPNEEAEKVALQLGRAGYIVDRRIESPVAIALEARRLRDGATAVRIITARGIAVAIDAPDRRYRARRSVSLGERPAFERRQSDGLYTLPIFVQNEAQRCIATILFDSEGFARELTREEDPHPNEGCYPEVAPPEQDGEDDRTAEEGFLDEGEPRFDADGLPLGAEDEEPSIEDDDFVIEPELNSPE